MHLHCDYRVTKSLFSSIDWFITEVSLVVLRSMRVSVCICESVLHAGDCCRKLCPMYVG